MLFESSPVALLRNGSLRTVFDGVWMEHLDLSGLQALTVLREHLQALPAEPRAGVIGNHVKLPEPVRVALNDVCSLVISQLDRLQLMPDGQADVFQDRAVLMATRGAQPHNDIGSRKWQNCLFWSLCLRDTDTDVLFGNLKLRFPQKTGTLLVFDPAQPHCVLGASENVFMKSHFPKGRTQIFAGGDFVPRDWAALGVQHDLPFDVQSARVDAKQKLVHQKTCLLNR